MTGSVSGYKEVIDHNGSGIDWFEIILIIYINKIVLRVYEGAIFEFFVEIGAVV